MQSRHYKWNSVVYSLLEATSDCACLHAAIYSLLETVDCTHNTRAFHLYTITEDIQKGCRGSTCLISQRSNISGLSQHNNYGVVSTPDTPEQRKGLVFWATFLVTFEVFWRLRLLHDMVYKSLVRPQSFLGKLRTRCEVSFSTSNLVQNIIVYVMHI